MGYSVANKMKNKEISLNTKREFARALKKLLKKEPLNKITVCELLTLTNKSRPTFYYHFRDAPDLIKWTVQDEIINLLEQSKGYEKWYDDLYQIFQYFAVNPTLGRAIYENLDIKQFNAIFREPQNRILLGYIDEVISKEKLHVSQKDRDFIAHFFTGGFTEIIIDWLNNGQKETPEEMRDMFRRTQKDVIVHCLKMADQSHKS